VRSIRRDVVYPHPPERVWAALTEPALMATWLMDVEAFEPRVGCRFRFRTKPAPGFDGVVHCEVREVVPHRRLVYTWGSGKMRERPTTVAWTLAPEGAGTRLSLDHGGFEGVAGYFLRTMLGQGWGRKLREYVGPVLDRLAAAGDDLARVDLRSVMRCDPVQSS
jgi:uncharacterized protein YndB with AHSA1/START domain